MAPVKRQRSELGERKRNYFVYSQSTNKNCYLNGSKALPIKTVEQSLIRSKNTRATLQKYYSKGLNGWIDTLGYYSEPVELPIFYERRRHAICYLFETMGSPKESLWENEGIVSDLMLRLNINRNSRSRVMEMLRDVLKSHDLSTIYDPLKNNQQRGRHVRIVENDDSAKSLYNSLKTGCGLPAANHIQTPYRGNLFLRLSSTIMFTLFTLLEYGATAPYLLQKMFVRFCQPFLVSGIVLAFYMVIQSPLYIALFFLSALLAILFANRRRLLSRFVFNQFQSGSMDVMPLITTLIPSDIVAKKKKTAIVSSDAELPADEESSISYSISSDTVSSAPNKPPSSSHPIPLLVDSHHSSDEGSSYYSSPAISDADDDVDDVICHHPTIIDVYMSDSDSYSDYDSLPPLDDDDDDDDDSSSSRHSSISSHSLHHQF